MLRFVEEIILLLLEEERGELAPYLPQHTLDLVLAGAVLMDLALDDRIDTDLEQLILVDPTPLEDDLLDPILLEIAQTRQVHDTSYWILQTAKRGDEIRDKALERLVKRDILEAETEGDPKGLFTFSRRVSRVRRYPVFEGKTVEDIRLRIMRVLFSDDIPDPRDIAIICLADASGVFERILSKEEQAEVQERIELVRRMDLIGRSVTEAIRELELPPVPPVVVRPFQEIPQARGVPIVGNAFDMMRDISTFLTKQYVELGPIFRVRTFNRRFVVFAGPEANRFMRRMGKTHFRSYELWRDFNRELGSMRSLISMDGPDHLRLRKVQVAGYSRKRIESQIDKAVSIVREEIAGWPQGKPITGQYTFQRIVLEQICALTASVSAREYLDDLIFFFSKLLKTRVTLHEPGFMMKLPRVQRARKRLDELYLKALAAHEPEKRRNESPDLLDDLLELHHMDSFFMPEIDLKLSFLGPFFAGIDTSASICAFMLYELLKRPDLREQITAEADELFGDGMPTAEGVQKLDITHRIAMETLRMYPIAPASRRTVTNAFEFEGYAIPAGTDVITANTVPHHLPEYFPNPERFDIERYTPERAEHRQEGAYAPFGLGTHRCLGSNFAELQIALNLATIMHETELVLDPPDYNLKINQKPLIHPDKSFKFRVMCQRK